MTYGVWARVHPDDLQRTFRAWWAPEYENLRLDGALANPIPPWHPARGHRRSPPAAVAAPSQKWGLEFRWPTGSAARCVIFFPDHLIGGQSVKRRIVSPDFVRYLIEEHQSGRRDNAHWLWSLLMLELWLREWNPASSATRHAEAVPA